VLGYIRLSYPASDDQVIAVAYRLSQPEAGINPEQRDYGVVEPSSDQIILQLLKPSSPTADDPTWDLSWKHVYDTGGSGLKPEDFEFRILRKDSEGSATRGAKTWVEIFGLDNRNNENGSLVPDGEIDAAFMNYAYGEVHFPDLTPMNPSGYVVGNDTVFTDLDTSETQDELYQLARTGRNVPANFTLESTYTSVSSQFDLGINVLEGSEEVYLNGRKLEKDRDYAIDYLSGQLTMINPEAMQPDANVEINYESGEIFQLDQRTMLGVRVEYALWEDSFLGATILYFNEKPIEKRVKVGSEPLRNFIWDLNARLRFRPYFMTQMVDALPLVETDEPSQLTFEGEIAQVFPNPNNLNNESTGDDNGVAYIDDFEASKRATPMSIMKSGWSHASHPVKLPIGDTPDQYDESDVRGWLVWYNDTNQPHINDIWPNRPTSSKTSKNVQILDIEYDPRINNFRNRRTQYSEDEDYRRTWNGIMRWMTPGFYNQAETKFIDIWMNWGEASDGMLVIDMGEISEDVIPNNELDTEDIPLEGTSQGNLILDDDEDVGIDRIEGEDPPWRGQRSDGSPRVGSPWLFSEQDFTPGEYDFWDINGNGEHDIVGLPPEEMEPFSSDDWAYGGVYYRINGTEGNAQEQGGTLPDTEDLDRNALLTQTNKFFRYRFRFNNPTDSSKYVVGGGPTETDNGDVVNTGWYLIRIPLEDYYEKIGEPSLDKIKFIRMFLTGMTSYTNLKIAQMELVGNEWLEEPVRDPATGDTTLYVTSSIINTYDNETEYNPPPGVEGEIDPITDIRSKEQSLVLQVEDFPTGAEGRLVKTLLSNQNLREYKQLKMFVHGGGRNVHAMGGKKLEMFLRFGRDMDTEYYEYSQRLHPGWEDNNILINLDQLTALKKKAEDSGRNTAHHVLPNGDVIRVVGQPSIGNISVYAVGLKNLGPPVSANEHLEVWVNELRVSNVRREAGIAMRSSMSAEFADFMTFNTSINQRDANFHQVDARVGSNDSKIDNSMDAKINLDRFLNPAAGFKIPINGSVKHSLSIPKYTTGNGDIRTEAVVEEEELNIWRRFADFLFDRSIYENRPYLTTQEGDTLVDEETGLPLQDPLAWGADTLLTTDQDYSWGTSFSKTKESPNPLIRYTVDKISVTYNNSQSWGSTQDKQYSKSFSNSGDASYSLPFKPADLKLFSWLEPVPWLNRMADSRFNYWPTQISVSGNVNETRSSDKNRGGEDRSTYSLSNTRSFSTGWKPFSSMNFDYSLSADSRYAREDSTQQNILYLDQPVSIRNRQFAPTTPPELILEETLQTLAADTMDNAEAREVYYATLDSMANTENLQEVVDWLFPRLNSFMDADSLKQPWNELGPGDERYDNTFWQIGGMPFYDTRKSQRVGGSLTPNVFDWLGTDASYSTNYTWSWSGTSYEGRSVNANTSLSGNLTFKLRQLLPQPERGGGRGNRGGNRGAPGRGGFGPGSPDLGPGGFGDPGRTPVPGENPRPEGEGDEGGDQDGGKGKKQDDEEKNGGGPKLPAINPLKGLLWAGQRIQDIRLSYSQSTNHRNPAVEPGDASLDYQLGLTGKPGLDVVEGAVQTQSHSRTDDYRIGSGLDITTRITTKLDYIYKLEHRWGQQTEGAVTRSAFFISSDKKGGVTLFDIPDYTLRIGGLEQLGPMQNFTQTVNIEHGYNGTFSEGWQETRETEIIEDTTGVAPPDTIETIQRSIRNRNYTRNFSPLVGLNITWVYGISTNIRLNHTVKVTANPANNSNARDTNQGISVSASYTRNTGFRIPIPIWPFKNRRFKNQTQFQLTADYNSTLKETQQGDADYSMTQETTNWSVQPQITYSFSRTVTGSVRYKYGVTKNSIATTRFQEFGINISISIRG
ncbi:cell surface protein SprA, partial [bacterium]|nr:cell surface protein SprA [bacterium]